MTINILVLGGGGREHTIAWKLRQSARCGKLYCAPGNPGIAAVAECVSVDFKAPFRALVDWCKGHEIGLVVVGPEDPLAAGVADALLAAGVKVFGPEAAGARIEASKQFAKEIMAAANIPTARSEQFTESGPAIAALDHYRAPYVIKADGLAAGKGVTVTADRAEAEAAIRDALDSKVFGDSGSSILIEEFLSGVEASLLAFTDGKTVRGMDSAQDHKPVFDGDKGPNTGGMGTVSPAPVLTPALRERAIREIVEPAVAEMARRGINYRGVLYAGLMVTAEGPKTIEFNCRFGDPETQVLLPRLKGDLVEIFLACAEGRLDQVDLAWSDDACVCVVAASEGYPGSYPKGCVITGLEGDAADSIIFHAGTANDAEGRIVTSGGRVLGVTALGETRDKAREKAYARLAKVHFDGMHFRRDIGFRAG